MPFRILNQAPQYLTADGRVNAGGSLTFYETGTTTPKDTFSDFALTTPNANPLFLDAAGRTLTDVWGDGEYTVVCKDAAGVIQWTRDEVRSDNEIQQTIPEGDNGEFLTTDGVQLLWAEIRQVPDPSGSSGKYLTTDGTNLIWDDTPEPPEPTVPDVVSTSTTFRIGALLCQIGSGTIPASGTRSASVGVTFATAFSGNPVHISVNPTIPTVSGSGFAPICNAISIGPSGFTASVDVNDTSGANITNSVPFTYLAIGPTIP